MPTFSEWERARQKSIELRRRWFSAPELFIREALGGEPWSKQIDVASSVVSNKRTIVKSGQKVGKSRLVAWIAIWWLFTRLSGKVLLTAPSEHQVKNILWAEVRAALGLTGRRPPVRLIDPSQCATDPRTGLRLRDGRAMFCVTTDSPERLQGISGDELLICVDEGSGYPQNLWAAINGNLTGGGKLLVTGNPTQTSGEFFEAYHSKSRFYARHTISSWETPNAVSGKKLIPGLALREECQESLEMNGEDHQDYQIRVLGNFPGQGSNSVVPLKLLEAAHKRWNDAPRLVMPDGSVRLALPPGRLDIGVDVARFGDDESVIACRRQHIGWIGGHVNGFDGVAVANEVKRTILRERKPGEPCVVKIDEIGAGAGVVDRLREMNRDGELGPAVTIIGINVAEVADDENEFPHKRDQLWFGLVLWLKQGAVLDTDDMLRFELVAPIYGYDERGRRKVESKKDMKKRLKRSPDRADALCLAVYSPASEIDSNKTETPVEPMSVWGSVEGRGFG